MKLKTFEPATCEQLEVEFNSWFVAMDNSVSGFTIVRTHVVADEGGYPMMFVLWECCE